MESREVVDIGVFSVEFIRVSHSLVDCFSLGIKTPVGTIIHTGDYKVDETPVIGEPIDLRSFRRYGQDGVLALLSDSTNATVPGRTPSERAVIPAFEEIFGRQRDELLSLRLRRQFTGCRSCSTWPSSLIVMFACLAVRCRRTSKSRIVLDISTSLMDYW